MFFAPSRERIIVMRRRPARVPPLTLACGLACAAATVATYAAVEARIQPSPHTISSAANAGVALGIGTVLFSGYCVIARLFRRTPPAETGRQRRPGPPPSGFPVPVPRPQAAARPGGTREARGGRRRITSRCCGPARVASVCCLTYRPASRVALPATERHPLCDADTNKHRSCPPADGRGSCVSWPHRFSCE